MTDPVAEQLQWHPPTWIVNPKISTMILSFLGMGTVLVTLLRAVFGQAPVDEAGASAWIGLNNSLGGRLDVGIPWSQPCFSTLNGMNVTPNATECSFVETNYFNSHCVYSLRDSRFSLFR